MVSSYFELNTKEQVIFFKNFSNFGPAQPGPSIFNLAQARPGPKANIDLGPWPGRAKISMAHFRPGPKNFGPNSSLLCWFHGIFFRRVNISCTTHAHLSLFWNINWRNISSVTWGGEWIPCVKIWFHGSCNKITYLLMISCWKKAISFSND